MQRRIRSGASNSDPEDASRFTANLGRFLSSGEYEVIWRGIGQDGHVVNGDWDFSVAGQ